MIKLPSQSTLIGPSYSELLGKTTKSGAFWDDSPAEAAGNSTRTLSSDLLPPSFHLRILKVWYICSPTAAM